MWRRAWRLPEGCMTLAQVQQLAKQPFPSPLLLLYLEVFQHGPFLSKKQRTRWALKDTDTLRQQVLVKV